MSTVTEIYQIIMNNVYLKFLFILAVSLVVAFIVKLITTQVLRPLAKKTKTMLDDLVIKSISSVIFFIILALGFKIGFQTFQFETQIYNNLVDTFLVLFVAIALFRIVQNIAGHWMEEWAKTTESTADDRLIPLIEKIVKAVIVILAVIFIFDAWDIDISPLLATAGIAGIAIGFAVRDSLANILGGLQLVLDKTFKVGDKVEIESGHMGVILDIGLRSTKLKTYDNEVIYIPNGQLANARIKNFTVPDLSVRVNVNFGVEYGSDSEKVRQVVLEAIKKIDGVLEDPAPVVQFLTMSDFALDYAARVWVSKYTDAYDMKLKMTDVIYKTLNDAGIGIPFPTRTIFTKSID
jgi:small-conductance mechanosensitive channel